MNFERTYDLIIEDIIQSVTPEELKDRQKEYLKIRLKTKFDIWINKKRMSKNEDGSYDVNGNVVLWNTQLTSLEQLPYKLNIINGSFVCHNNYLTNLKGCPNIIHDDFDCSYNNLTSLEGCPKRVKNDFIIRHMKNRFIFTEEDIRKICKVGGDVIV